MGGIAMKISKEAIENFKSLSNVPTIQLIVDADVRQRNKYRTRKGIILYKKNNNEN